jgi:putative membrane protein
VITSYALATLNALLNTAALACVLFGYIAIRGRKIQTHKRFMLSAFVLSLLFLTSYLTRIVMFGDTKFPGQGAIRPVYFFILISHIILAITIAPAVLYTVILGLNRKWAKHKKWAPKVLPVWVYVLVTGVIVYLMLHHWPTT